MSARRQYTPAIISMGMPSALPWTPTPAPPLSAQLLDAGRLLAHRSLQGEFIALGEDHDQDFRCLARQLVGWADVVETMEQAARVQRRPGRLRCWWRRCRERMRLG